MTVDIRVEFMFKWIASDTVGIRVDVKRCLSYDLCRSAWCLIGHSK